MTAALEVIRSKGLAGATARGIAAAAGVNQALIFYHFGSVSELIEAASNREVDARVANYREEFNAADSLPGLLAIGRAMHTRERLAGNVAIMAQLMAAGPQDVVLARAARYAVAAWTQQVTTVVDHVLADTPASAFLDAAGLAHTISATFIGIELLHGVDSAGAQQALTTLEKLNELVGVINSLGPTSKAAMRLTIRRASAHPEGPE